MKLFKLKLISPEGVKYQAEASEASIPTPDGQITILPNHTPLISIIAAGEIKLKIADKERLLVTEGGVLEVANNNIVILADTAEDLSSLDELKIESAKKQAQQLISEAKDEIDRADAMAQLERQIAKLNILKRRKKYRG